MLGSRGTTPPDVVAGLGVLAELLRNIDPTLVGRLEELQAEERRIGEQRAALKTAEAENQARVGQLEQRKAGIDAAATAVIDREAACATSAAATARLRARLDEESRAIEARAAELIAERERQEQAKRDFATACERERGKIAAERQAAAEQIAKDRQQAATAAQEDEATHVAQIGRLHEVAVAELDRQKRELLQRQAALADRETAIRDRAAQLRAALGE
jgi:hypothetical protein